MKSKLIFASALLVIFVIAMAAKSSEKAPKMQTTKINSSETRVNKGLSLEDRNQFN